MSGIFIYDEDDNASPNTISRHAELMEDAVLQPPIAWFATNQLWQRPYNLNAANSNDKTQKNENKYGKDCCFFFNGNKHIIGVGFFLFALLL